MGRETSPFLFSMKFISTKEYNKIHKQLSEIDKTFAEMWKRFERMVFDNDEETVALDIDNANFRIIANNKFWKKCGDETKVFIICHEMCHAMFGHWMYPEKYYREWANVAQDIQVNEFLFKNYNFSKSIAKVADCATIETVFKHKSNLIERDRNYTYYYDLLMKCLKS